MRPTPLLLLLAACGPGITDPPAPPIDTQYVKLSSCGEITAAVRTAEVTGGTVDFNGLACSGVAIELRSSPLLVQQVRFVRLTNCGGGLTPPPGQPVLRVAAGVSAYFVTLDRCLLFGTVDMTRMYNSRLEQVWILPAAGPAIRLAGPGYYNVIDQAYFAGGLEATAPGGAYTGPNSNTLRDSRSQSGTVTIGPHVQNWRFEGNSFEGCGGVCLSLAGPGTAVAAGNRFEGGTVGIDLLGGDGTIGTQYWSSLTVARIRFSGADVGSWVIAPQPAQQ